MDTFREIKVWELYEKGKISKRHNKIVIFWGNGIGRYEYLNVVHNSYRVEETHWEDTEPDQCKKDKNGNPDKISNTKPRNVTSWKTGAYRNNEKRSKRLFIDGANTLEVTIKGTTERRYDNIYIYNANGRLIEKLSGKINHRVRVNGDAIKAKLVTDRSVTKSGVQISINKVVK